MRFVQVLPHRCDICRSSFKRAYMAPKDVVEALLAIKNGKLMVCVVACTLVGEEKRDGSCVFLLTLLRSGTILLWERI